MGLILVGMPGLEKRLARYPQRYSRVGFVHQYRTLDRGEQQDDHVQHVGQWKSLTGVEGTTPKEALAHSVRMTGGNGSRRRSGSSPFCARILELNPVVEIVSREVVETAREQLVCGKGI